MRLLSIIFFLSFYCFSQKTFVTSSDVSFFSDAPLEDIAAVSNKMQGVVDFDTGNFYFRIPINTFIFPSSLMQKHFNEKYMESEKFTLSSFKGMFKEKISISKNQKINIFAEGVLEIHGVKRSVFIETNLDVLNGQVKFKSVFDVYLKDYQIKVPKIVRMNIADTIQVNVSGILLEKNN